MGRWPPFLSHAASLPAVVVLPEPCSPAIRMTLGGCEANLKRAVSLPSSVISSSRTILITCSEGESAVSTSVPTAFTRICSIRSVTTLRLTSASSSATRIRLSASVMFSSVSVPWPRRTLKARCNLSVRFSNIGLLQVYPAGGGRSPCNPTSQNRDLGHNVLEWVHGPKGGCRLQDLLRRRNQVLLQLAVGIGVRRQPQPLARIDNQEAAKGHAATQLCAVLLEAKRLAQRR